MINHVPTEGELQATSNIQYFQQKAKMCENVLECFAKHEKKQLLVETSNREQDFFFYIKFMLF